MTDRVDELILPIITERLVVDRRTVAAGTIKVRTITENEPHEVRATLTHGSVEIDRIAIGEEVLTVPPVREEGATIVVPVVREEIVVTKRLILVEEVRMRRVTTTEEHVETVMLSTQHAVIDRQTPEENQ